VKQCDTFAWPTVIEGLRAEGEEEDREESRGREYSARNRNTDEDLGELDDAKAEDHVNVV